MTRLSAGTQGQVFRCLCSQRDPSEYRVYQISNESTYPFSVAYEPPAFPSPTSPSCLHGNWEQLNLRATARNPGWNEEILPEELRDAVPPIASCQRLVSQATLLQRDYTHKQQQIHIPNHPTNTPAPRPSHCKPDALKKKPSVEPYPASNTSSLIRTKFHAT